MSNHTAPILLAVDGTGGSAGALRYAAAEARRTGRTVRIAHVMPGFVPLLPMLPMPEENLRTIGNGVLAEAEAAIAASAPEVAVVLSLRIGSRVAHLLDLANGSAIVVLGRDLPDRLDRVLTGAVSTRVAGRSQRPVVVVPADWAPAREDAEAGDVLVGVKSDAHADELLAEAFHRAAATLATVRVLHAWVLPDAYVDRIQEHTHGAAWLASGRHLLDQLLAKWIARYPDVPVAVDVVHGRPEGELRRAAARAQLLVIGRPGRRLDPLGATGRTLLLSAPSPVEIVPPGSMDEGDLVLERAGELAR